MITKKLRFLCFVMNEGERLVLARLRHICIEMVVELQIRCRRGETVLFEGFVDEMAHRHNASPMEIGEMLYIFVYSDHIDIGPNFQMTIRKQINIPDIKEDQPMELVGFTFDPVRA